MRLVMRRETLHRIWVRVLSFVQPPMYGILGLFSLSDVQRRDLGGRATTIGAISVWRRNRTSAHAARNRK